MGENFHHMLFRDCFVLIGPGLYIWLCIYGVHSSQVAVNFLGVAVLAQESAKSSHSPHPNHLLRHTGIRRAPALPVTLATAINSAGSSRTTHTDIHTLITAIITAQYIITSLS